MTATEFNSVYFLHIPKTAGTSFISLLSTLFTYRAYQQGLQIRSIYSATRFIEPKLLERSRLLFGHIPLSISSFLPKPTLAITFLRNPIDLCLSYFYYNQKRGLISKDISLSEFIRSPQAATISNIQTRWMAEHAILEPTSNTVTGPHRLTSEHLDIATENLQSFDFIGNASDFPASIASLSESLGITFAEIPRHNRTDSPISIPKDDLSVLNELNKMDFEICNFAFDILNKDKPVHRFKIRDFNSTRGIFNSPHRGFFSAIENSFIYRSFYPLETLPTGEAFRWSKTTTTINLPIIYLAGTNYTLIIHVVNFISQERLDSLKIYIDGHEVPHQIVLENTYCQIKALLGFHIFRQGIDLGLQVYRVNDTIDHRDIGLAIDWIYCGIADEILEQAVACG